MNTIIILFYVTLINVISGVPPQILPDDDYFLMLNNYERAKELEKQNIFSVNDDRVPIKYNNFSFEGDIIIPKSEKNKNRYIKSRVSRHWPKGDVPFIIESEFNENELAILAQAVNWFKTNTCIKWINLQAQHTDYVAIIRGKNGRYCSSNLGRIGGRQILELGYGCFSRSTIIHQMQHTIGFIHEQSRADRDRYVQVFYERIEPGMKHNFRNNQGLYDKTWTLSYDPNSNMHYTERAFGINNSITIQAKNGQRLGCEHLLSQCPTQLDIEKINTAYFNECKK